MLQLRVYMVVVAMLLAFTTQPQSTLAAGPFEALNALRKFRTFPRTGAESSDAVPLLYSADQVDEMKAIDQGTMLHANPPYHEAPQDKRFVFPTHHLRGLHPLERGAQEDDYATKRRISYSAIKGLYKYARGDFNKARANFVRERHNPVAQEAALQKAKELHDFYVKAFVEDSKLRQVVLHNNRPIDNAAVGWYTTRRGILKGRADFFRDTITTTINDLRMLETKLADAKKASGWEYENRSETPLADDLEAKYKAFRPEPNKLWRSLSNRIRGGNS